MSQKRTAIVTLGIMLSLFMAAVESTVVATAMPTIVSELGGLASYSWVFSAYMLTSTTTVPLYGKLSDIFGRRRIFLVAMALFVIGSVLSGVSATMTQLIAFRALQGLGAGGLMPLAFIMIGDMFSFEQRARMQGLFSGVWGVASIIGPLLGGFLVDQLSWHWVFYVNVIPALLATLIVGLGWREHHLKSAATRPSIDFAGTLLLSGGVVMLLLGLFMLGKPVSWLLLATSTAALVGLYFVEHRAADPVLPLGLFRGRLFTVATLHGILAGWAMFGSTNYVPLFGQTVLGVSATAAGSALTPQMLSWVVAAIIGSRLLLRYGYRSIALVGMASLMVGTLLMTRMTVNASLAMVMVALSLMGIGMGLSVPALLIAVQSSVPRRQLGTATATVQFSRSMGGTLGVSVMGVILTTLLTRNLAAVGLDPAALSLGDMIHRDGGLLLEGLSNGAVQSAFSGAINGVFVAAFVAAALAFIVIWLAPRERIARPESVVVRAPEPEAVE